MGTFIKHELGKINNKDVIFIRFAYDAELVARVKKLVGAQWSQTQHAWYVPANTAYLKKFKIAAAPVKTIPRVSETNQDSLKRYHETLLLKGYSSNTLRTYLNEFTQFLKILHNHHVDNITAERLRDYFIYCRKTLKLSENTIHSRMNAIKFYYEQVLHQDHLFFDIPRMKKPQLLPNVLAVSQIESLFRQLKNLKHRTMLFLAYSAGLRVSEVVGLRVKDIHSERMVINIKGAKGKKDRTVVLSNAILNLLREYYRLYHPKDWLFEGQYGESYSARSLQQIFHRAKNQANITQDVTFHSLRHSYATHLHERGTDIKLIQELLGHNDIKTTLRYTHVSKATIEHISSPFDDLNLEKDGR